MSFGIEDRFELCFGRRPHVTASAGGRVNLIGEHTDYHEGFVFPAAIDLRTVVAASARKDSTVHIRSENVQRDVVVGLGNLTPEDELSWRSYVLGPFWALMRQGVPIQGADVLVASDVPFGGGLSSSAAIEVALVAAAACLAGTELDASTIAALARRAENDFCHVPCGTMDQLASACGQKEHVLLIDCRTLAIQPVAFPPPWALVVVDSGVKHSVAGDAYARRQRECFDGLNALRATHPELKAARDIELGMLEQERKSLSPVAERRLRHVVTENARVLQARDALLAVDASLLGALLFKSHESLASDYEVSCPELDVLVDIAAKTPGVYGARLTGAGFGGNTVNLVDGPRAKHVCEAIRQEYEARTGRSTVARVVRPSAGVIVTRAGDSG